MMTHATTTAPARVMDLRPNLAAHGVGRAWWTALTGSWCALVLAAFVSVPPVDGRIDVMSRPMESMATMMLVVVVAVQAAALEEKASWLVVSGVRRFTVDRLTWWLFHLVLGLLTSALAVIWLPGVPRAHLALLWALCFSLSTVGAVAADVLGATVLPCALIGAMSMGAVMPWTWNVVYNLELRQGLLLLSSTMTLVGMVAYARLGTRNGRE